jgi:Gpi18-like mannosyltransferase
MYKNHAGTGLMRKKLQQIFLSPIFIGLILLIGLIFRMISLPVISLDMQAGLFDWYGFILKRGFWGAFKENFALYTPPYLYLLWLATLVNGIVSRVTLIKLISIIFDIICAFYIYKITALKYSHTRIPWLAAALAFSLPTVILNSSYWGQCDSIYTAFLLGCLYYLLTNHSMWGLLFFGVAFAFKLQAIFFIPFLGVYFLRKKIPWLSTLLIPAVYVAMVLPTVIAGRPWLDVLTIYAQQTDKFPKWSSTTPTMYLPLQGRIPLTDPLTLLTVILAASILSVWVFLAWKKPEKNTLNGMVLTALASVALVPFILPRMHQRYFFPQDVFSLVAAFFMPELWFLPILSQIISVLAYGPFLFNINFQLNLFGRNLNAILYLALPLELLILAITLWMQFRKPAPEKAAVVVEN